MLVGYLFRHKVQLCHAKDLTQKQRHVERIFPMQGFCLWNLESLVLESVI